MSMVSYKQSDLPPLTEERKAELKALAERPDSEIDFSDIPPLDETFWARGGRRSWQRLPHRSTGRRACRPTRV